MKPRRVAAAASLVAALSVALGGCTTDDGHSHMDDLDANYSMSVSPPDLSYPPTLGVRDNEPRSVAIAAVETIYGWDFIRDRAGADAVERATPLMSAALAGRLQVIVPEPFIPPATWSDWKKDRAQTSVSASVAVDEHPADTADQWQRRITVTIVVSAADRELFHRTFVVAVTTQRQAGQWVLAQFQPLGI